MDKFTFKEVFEGCTYPWEALEKANRLKAELDQCRRALAKLDNVPPRTTIKLGLHNLKLKLIKPWVDGVDMVDYIELNKNDVETFVELKRQRVAEIEKELAAL